MRRMKRVVRTLGMGILLVLAIAGCSKFKGDKKSPPEDGKGQVPNVEAVPGKEAAEKVEEVSLNPDSTVLSVGSQTVPFCEVMAYMYFLKSRYQTEFGDGIWSYEVQGQTFGRKSLEEVLHMVTEMKVIRKEAEASGLQLTVSELDEVGVRAENYLAAIPPEDAEQYGLNVEVLTTVFGDNEIAGKMFDVCMNEVNTQITDEEARQMVVQYLLVMTNGTNKNGVTVQMDEAGRADARNRAMELAKDAKKADSFFAFAEANTDLGHVEQTVGRSSMSEAFIQAAWGLPEGQVSDVVETPEGYYVIHSVEDFDEKATKQEKERIILEEQTRVFEQKYAAWADKYQVRISDLLWDVGEGTPPSAAPAPSTGVE